MRRRRFHFGPSVALSVPPTEGEGGPWSVLAYRCDLLGYRLADGSYARVTDEDIDQMVANFTRYPKAPLVVEHADTRGGAVEHSEPRGWIVALRRGTYTLPSTGEVVTALEGRIDASPEVRLSINGDAAKGIPPTWPFCSITTARGVDQATGASLGTTLYSVSLTAHPRLGDLPRLAAGMGPELGGWWGDITTRSDLIECLRCVFELPVATDEARVLSELDKLEALASDPAAAETAGVDAECIVGSLRSAMRLPALTTATEVLSAIRGALTTLPGAPGASLSIDRGQTAKEKPMPTFMELAVELKLAAVSDEESARRAVVALAQEAITLRTSLGVAAGEPSAPRVETLVTAAAELSRVKPELDELRTAQVRREEEALTRRVKEICLAKGWGEDAEPALLALGRADRQAFDEKYPAPSVEELAQRTQDGARLAQVVTTSAKPAGKDVLPADTKPAPLGERVAKLRGVYARAGVELSMADALSALDRGDTPELAEKALAARAQS